LIIIHHFSHFFNLFTFSWYIHYNFSFFLMLINLEKYHSFFICVSFSFYSLFDFLSIFFNFDCFMHGF